MNSTVTFFNVEYLYQLIFSLFASEGIFSFLSPLWQVLMILGYLLTLIFIVGIIYSLIRLKKVREEESGLLDILTQQALEKHPKRTNARWIKVTELADSDNENDWRRAILEADVILDELLETIGYDGMSVGEKLKSVEKSDFNTVDMAWSAHKVRNRIAHEGGNFVLSKQETRRVIGLYQSVFEEFEYL